MAISKKNAEKLNWLWLDENKIEWIGTFIQIANKQGNIVPFVFTDEQRQFVEKLEHKNIVSKSRQLGLSVCVCGLAIRECVIYPNTSCALISHSQESTNKVFDKLKQMYYSLPDWLRPKQLINNRQALAFDNGSSITCMTAGNKDVLRGATINGVCHMSEFALWKNQESQLQSIMQAVTDSAVVIIESTTKGFNRYSQMYMEARGGENDFKPFFFNFINGRALFEEQYKQCVRSYKARHKNKMLTVEDYDEEEIYLATLGMTPDQAVWRRSKIAESSLDAFHEEFPSSFEESCLVTGSSIFDKERIAKNILAIADKKIRPLNVDQVVGISSLLRQYYGKSFSVWKLPKAGERYYIGVDCSEGLRKDYSTAIVLDKEGEQVAEFKNNQVKPYQYADVVDALGRYYNKALITVEKASGGHSVIERLRYDKHYMNMTKYQTYDEFRRSVWHVGFDTNNKTKSIIVNDCREWFEKGLIKINSTALLDEMKVFIANDNGSMGAVNGSHDDLCMALCLCITGMKAGFWYPF